MTLKITLKPNERIVVNGCVIRNTDRRNALVFETHADIVREADLLTPDAKATPVGRAYYLIQTALLQVDLRDKIVGGIQQDLANLAACFSDRMRGAVVQAATHVSCADYYKALSALRPVLRYEATLLEKDPQATGGGDLVPA